MEQEPYNDVKGFAEYFLNNVTFKDLKVQMGGIVNYGDLIGLVIHRVGQFQVELFIVPPGKHPKPMRHRHPNIDSIEVFLNGGIDFVIEDFHLQSEDDLKKVKPDGTSPILGKYARVKETSYHSASMVFEEGGSFLSIQHWLNGVKPSSVGLDWEGEFVSEEHVRAHG